MGTILLGIVILLIATISAVAGYLARDRELAIQQERIYSHIQTRVNLIAVHDDGIDESRNHKWHMAYLDDPDPVRGGFDTKFCLEDSRIGPPFERGMRIDQLSYIDTGPCWSIDPLVSQKLGYLFHREQGKIIRVSLPFTQEEEYEQARK